MFQFAHAGKKIFTISFRSIYVLAFAHAPHIQNKLITMCASCCPAYGSTISSSFPSRRPFARYALLIRRPVCRQNHTHHRPRRCSVLKNHVHPPPRFPLLRRRSRSCGVRGGVTHRAHVARTQASGERRAPGEAQDRVFSPVRQEAVVVAILVH